jgi:hypothetical protein
VGARACVLDDWPRVVTSCLDESLDTRSKRERWRCVCVLVTGEGVEEKERSSVGLGLADQGDIPAQRGEVCWL